MVGQKKTYESLVTSVSISMNRPSLLDGQGFKWDVLLTLLGSPDGGLAQGAEEDLHHVPCDPSKIWPLRLKVAR